MGSERIRELERERDELKRRVQAIEWEREDDIRAMLLNAEIMDLRKVLAIVGKDVADAR